MATIYLAVCYQNDPFSVVDLGRGDCVHSNHRTIPLRLAQSDQSLLSNMGLERERKEQAKKERERETDCVS